MPKFSQKSLDRLQTCDERLQRVLKIAIRHYDFSVLDGHRGRERQNQAFMKGHSKVEWPNSRHNKIPSLAVDIAPYPIDWEDIDRFKELGRLVLAIADTLKIRIEWGGYWKTLKDYPHFQVEKE